MKFNQFLIASMSLGFALIEFGAIHAQQPAPVPAKPLPALILRKQVATKAQPTTPSVDQASSDAKALDAASLKADDAQALLGYIRQRTLSDADLSRIQAVIKRLGADDFEERMKAASEVERFGPAAVGPLRTASDGLRNPDTATDFEVAYRASECLKRMEKVPHAAVAAATVRALAKLKPPETAKVLLAFLPLADDQAVADEIRKTLKLIAVVDGKAEPALLSGLTDPVPDRRAAAAVALIEGGSSKERIRIKDAYPKVQELAKTEKDIETKFIILYSLLTTSREKDAVGEMISMLADLPRGRMWQAEDYLLQLAGKDAPKATLGRTKESLVKARDTWKAWWDKSLATVDLEKFAFTPRVTGNTLLILMDFRFGSSGSVVELGPDMKERWKILGLASPMDAQFLPDGSLAIAEHNSNRLTIRDTSGRILSSKTIGGANRVFGNPQQVQILENGNILVTCRNVIVEFKKDKDEEVMRYVRNNYDITAAYRLDDGQTMVLCQNGPNHAIFLDAKGKEINDRKLKTGMPYYQAHVTASGPDRLLVTELNQVVEYDLKKNESVWKKQVNQPRSVQRLPNGNTLIVDATSNKLVEYSPESEEVWSYQPTSGFQVFRAYRR